MASPEHGALRTAEIIGFVGARDLDRARRFCGEVLGLDLRDRPG